MPIPLPNLDDRTFDDLTLEARALISGLAPDWTNHNVSDPGITLIELLAWLTEMLLFEVNQVPPAHTEKFLKLLNGPGCTRPDTQSLDAAARQTVLALRQRYRAVDAADYEELALAADGRVRRVRCVPGRNLEAADPGQQQAAPAHVSLVVVPGRVPDQPEPPQPPDDLRAALSSLLDERRILTTRLHVVGPSYVPVQISANLALQPDAPPDEALQVAQAALGELLTRWTAGRTVGLAVRPRLSAAEISPGSSSCRWSTTSRTLPSTVLTGGSSMRRSCHSSARQPWPPTTTAGSGTRKPRARKPRAGKPRAGRR
jgi:hypothetical protein